eukprot:m.50825 g.50825  ORF g.50825 m.50825 type:complete len:354 (+) comp6257_c0_seq2:2-1063(+)
MSKDSACRHDGDASKKEHQPSRNDLPLEELQAGTPSPSHSASSHKTDAVRVLRLRARLRTELKGVHLQFMRCCACDCVVGRETPFLLLDDRLETAVFMCVRCARAALSASDSHIVMIRKNEVERASDRSLMAECAACGHVEYKLPKDAPLGTETAAVDADLMAGPVLQLPPSLGLPIPTDEDKVALAVLRKQHRELAAQLRVARKEQSAAARKLKELEKRLAQQQKGKGKKGSTKKKLGTTTELAAGTSHSIDVDVACIVSATTEESVACDTELQECTRDVAQRTDRFRELELRFEILEQQLKEADYKVNGAMNALNERMDTEASAADRAHSDESDDGDDGANRYNVFIEDDD